MMEVNIQQATTGDAAKLSAIAFAAKSHWGYPASYLDLWKDDLTITHEYVRKNTVLKAIDGKGNILGFGAIEFSSAFDDYEIGHMWIHPDYMRKGIGRIILDSLIQHAHEEGITKLYALSDPNAQKFYEKRGFVLTGQQESQPKGRYLPVLVLQIEE